MNLKTLILILLFPLLAFGQQSIQSNSLKLGKKTTQNKDLIFEINQGAANPRVRANGSTQKLQFTNDGTNYKDIGSGSGGGSGINTLQDLNFDFEAGTTNWTVSGGTFVTSNSPALNGAASGLFTASASGQTLRSALVTVPAHFIGRNCQVDGLYSFPSGTAGSLVYEVLDGSDNVLAQTDVIATVGTDVSTIRFPQFTCPTSGSIRFGVRSTAAAGAALRLDDIFLGTGRNTVQIAQAAFAGESYFTPTTSCTWTRTNTALGPFGTTAACPGPTITVGEIGQWQTTDSDLPRQTILNLPPGKYKATFFGNVNNSVASAGNSLAIFDGVTTCNPTSGQHNVVSSGMGVSCIFSYTTTQASRSFELYGASSANAITINSVPGSTGGLRFQLEYYPLNSASGITTDTSGWFIDASISGPNTSLGNTTINSYTEITNGSLTLVRNPGSQPVGIACSGTNPSVVNTTTCSAGSESMGITFNIPVAYPLVLACASFSHAISNAAGGATESVFQLVETPSNAQTLSQEGKSKLTSANNNPSSTTIYPARVCGTFNFATSGQKTLRVMYEQVVTGTITSNLMITDLSPAYGQRDVHWEVYPIGQQSPAPIFPEVVNKANAGAPLIQDRAAGVSCNAGPTFSQTAPWIQSVTYLSAGRCSVNLVPGTFSASPLCNVNVVNSGAPNGYGATISTTTSAINIAIHTSTGTGADAGVYLRCSGQ